MAHSSDNTQDYVAPDELERRLLQIMFKHTPTATVGALLVFAIDWWLYRGSFSGWVLGLWGGLFLIALIARLVVYALYLRSPDLVHPTTYRRWFTACVLLHGIAWAPMVHGALHQDDAAMHLYA
ncbi:MAG: hypothetical protein AAFX85_20020, partial [Pseudomonadota bacterium]